MFDAPLIAIFTATVAVFALLFASSIFKKVYDEDYKKPWFFIGISAIILSIGQLLRFLYENFDFQLFPSETLTEFVIYTLDFVSTTVLAYALMLEYLILKYYKGKFVKMKFIPVQEGNYEGNLDLDVTNGFSYLLVKKDRNFVLEQFSKAILMSYEGFLICEDKPSDIRSRYNIVKTPIAWIYEENLNNNSYIKAALDSNSDVVSPLQLNNIINYVDSFLEQSKNPFIVIDLNLIFKTNSFTVVEEFLKYLSSRVIRYNGVFICLINEDVETSVNFSSLKLFLKELN